jgi:hypothetical protein
MRGHLGVGVSRSLPFVDGVVSLSDPILPQDALANARRLAADRAEPGFHLVVADGLSRQKFSNRRDIAVIGHENPFMDVKSASKRTQASGSSVGVRISGDTASGVNKIGSKKRQV